jgi:hypothetical protein
MPLQSSIQEIVVLELRELQMVFFYADKAFRLLLSLVKTTKFAGLSKSQRTICFQNGNYATGNEKEEHFFAILNVQLSQ